MLLASGAGCVLCLNLLRAEQRAARGHTSLILLIYQLVKVIPPPGRSLVSILLVIF